MLKGIVTFVKDFWRPALAGGLLCGAITLIFDEAYSGGYEHGVQDYRNSVVEGLTMLEEGYPEEYKALNNASKEILEKRRKQ